MLKLTLSTLLAFGLLFGLIVTPVRADGAEAKEECEIVTVVRTVEETGAYGQKTPKTYEEKRCKIPAEALPAAGLDPVTDMALASLVLVGFGAYTTSRRLA